MEESRKMLQKTDENLKYAINSNMAATEFLRGMKDSQPNAPVETIKELCPTVIDKEDTMKYKNIKITKRTDNRYQARFLCNGTYKYVYAKTQLECYNKLKLTFEPNVKIKKSIKLNEWIETWRRIYKVNKIKESTLYHIDLMLKNYITNTIGKMTITNIQVMDVENLLSNINGGRLKQIIYTHLVDIFGKAQRNKVIKENIMTLVEKPKHTKAQTKAFNREEQRLFIEKCKQSKYGDFFLILLHQGMRRGELLALTRNDIDFEQKTITINKSINDLGKETTPKTKTSIRTIPIFSTTLPILEKYKDTNGRLFKCSKNPLQIEFTRIMNELNFENFKIHSLRHTFITRWTELGAPSKLIQKWVGHEDNNITEKVYTKINSDFETAFIRKFDTDFDTDFSQKN